MSKRGDQWRLFADKVLNHIEEYTVPQYGDAPNDSVSEWDSKDCFASIHKYVKRFGNNQREGQQYLDMMKIAHYACLVHDKMKKEETAELERGITTYNGNIKYVLDDIQRSKHFTGNENVEITIVIKE